jgi:hypothetical protein
MIHTAVRLLTPPHTILITAFTFFLLVTALFDIHVLAQQTFPLATAQFHWNWQKGTTPGVDDGDPLGFKLYCGKQSAAYSLQLLIANPEARTAPVRDVITGSGSWYCVVTAYNEVGESKPSNELFFSAAAGTSSPTNLTLTPN